MSYITCPRCHATFQSGLLHESLDACSRCGEPFHRHRSIRDQFMSVVTRRARNAGASTDWEQITGSQYAGRRSVTKPK